MGAWEEVGQGALGVGVRKALLSFTATATTNCLLALSTRQAGVLSPSLSPPLPPPTTPDAFLSVFFIVTIVTRFPFPPHSRLCHSRTLAILFTASPLYSLHRPCPPSRTQRPVLIHVNRSSSSITSNSTQSSVVLPPVLSIDSAQTPTSRELTLQERESLTSSTVSRSSSRLHPRDGPLPTLLAPSLSPTPRSIPPSTVSLSPPGSL